MSFQWTAPASIQGAQPAAHWRTQLGQTAPQPGPSRSVASPRRTATPGVSELSPPGFAEAPLRSAPPVARIAPFRDHLQVALTDDRTLTATGIAAEMAVDVDALPTLAPGTTLVGLIDDGIAFANSRFRLSETQSRFAYFWQQDHPVTAQDSCPTVPFGREITGSTIDTMLSDHMSEADVYASLGLGRIGQRRLLRQANYGTSIADAVAGAAPDAQIGDKPAGDVRLLGVNIPDASLPYASGTVIEPFVVLAVQRIMDHVTALEAKASEAAGQPVHFPLVFMVSMSILDMHGTTPGPLPLLLRQIASDREGLAPTHVMSPQPQRRHARLLPQTVTELDTTCRFTLPEGCTQSTMIEITACSGIEHLRASLQPPSITAGQGTPPPLDVGQFVFLTGEEQPDATVAAIYRSGARLMVMIAPTSAGSQAVAAQPGAWQLHITGTERAQGVQVVIHRGSLPEKEESVLNSSTPTPRITLKTWADVCEKSGKSSLHVAFEQDSRSPVASAPTTSPDSGGTAMATALATRRLISTL